MFNPLEEVVLVGGPKNNERMLVDPDKKTLVFYTNTEHRVFCGQPFDILVGPTVEYIRAGAPGDRGDVFIERGLWNKQLYKSDN